MAQRAVTSTSPPRPVLAFRVGVVGHRPNRLPKESLGALRETLRIILENVKAELSAYASSSAAALFYADSPFIIRAVSPLAEGTDRIFAEEAVDLGFQLLCPLPFSREEFEQDFLSPNALEPNSQEKFRNLLQRGRESEGVTLFELDGVRSAAPQAYAFAGRIVLNQSDLLIAVWDGHKPAGEGSTVGTTREALAFQAPVLWIDALAPSNWQLVRAPQDVKGLDGNARCVPQHASLTDPVAARNLLAESIRRIVREEIVPPEASPGQHQTQKTMTKSPALAYFRERRPRFNLAVAWKLFRDAVGSAKFHLPQVFVADFEAQVRNEWPVRDDFADSSNLSAAAKLNSGSSVSPSDLDDWVNRRLRAHFAWADKRSDLYADAYRSGYVLTYLLSATAVFIALPRMAAGLEGDAQTICVAIEFVVPLTFSLFSVGRTRRWHERWMEYRLLAESIGNSEF